MNSTTETTPTPMTDDEVKSMILRLLREAGGEALWSDIHPQLPCLRWHAGELGMELLETGRIRAFRRGPGNGKFIALPLTGSVTA